MQYISLWVRLLRGPRLLTWISNGTIIPHVLTVLREGEGEGRKGKRRDGEE